MLTITVGITILKDLLKTSLLEASKEQIELWKRISQHKIALSLELQEQYIKYCEEKMGAMELEQMRTFLASILVSQDMTEMITIHNKSVQLVKDDYLDALLSVCLNTDDRILLGNKSKINKNIIDKKNIQIFEKKDIMNIDTSRNVFTMYTVPIICYQIKRNESSKELGAWIGRILRGQKEFTIYDNYIGTSTNIKNFKNYILKYIPHHSGISIITIETDKVKETDLKAEFAKEFYKKWSIEVFVAKNKKESHPRVIVMPNYAISLDKGIQTFGTNGKTESSAITIKENSLDNHYIVKNTKKIYP